MRQVEKSSGWRIGKETIYDESGKSPVRDIVNRQICLFLALISGYQTNLPYNQWLTSPNRFIKSIKKLAF
jgi:hypothetical protein